MEQAFLAIRLCERVDAVARRVLLQGGEEEEEEEEEKEEEGKDGRSLVVLAQG